MALFTPEMMAGFQSVEIPASFHYGNKADKLKRVFQTKGSPHSWIQRAQALRADKSLAGEYFNARLNASESSRWLGFGNQSKIDALNSGVVQTALDAFQKADGGLETHYTRAAPELRAVGSAYSVGRVMQGHPKAALYRPKAKLPPKTIEVCLSVSGGVSQDEIAAQMSKIAKAIWQYSMAGGIVEFSVSFLCQFNKRQEWNGKMHDGLMDTLRINPSNAAQYATAASGQFFRGFHIPLAQALSGQAGGHDSLMCLNWNKPGVFQFTGYMKDSEAVLAALKVR